MIKAVTLALAFIWVLPAIFCVDPTMRLGSTTVYVEFHGPCRQDGSFNASGGGRLRPVVVQGFPSVAGQQAHVVLANVTDLVPVNPEEESLESSHDSSGHHGGGAEGLHVEQPAVDPHADLQGNFYGFYFLVFWQFSINFVLILGRQRVEVQLENGGAPATHGLSDIVIGQYVNDSFMASVQGWLLGKIS